MARYGMSYFAVGVRADAPHKSRGVPLVDDRQVLNGIFWVLRSRRTMGLLSRTLRSDDDLLMTGSSAGPRQASETRS